MAKIDDVLKQELGEISLSSEEKASYETIAKDIVAKLEKEGLKAFVGGSLAKGTMIKKDVQDLDIFVVFEDAKEDLLESVLKKQGFNYDVVHGSRDYYKLKFDSVLVELIPVSKVENPDDAENVTDLSLRHVEYVNKKIKKDKNIVDEIKLAKAFCFAQDVYGAESYIQGFSGYALEVLMIYFKSFKKFLKWVVKKSKKDNVVLDPEKHFKSVNEVMREINESKLSSPLIVVDPTYRFRNITAALSEETFDKFVDSAKRFLKKPDLDFFVKKNVDVESLNEFAKKNNAKFIEIEFKTDRQEGDVAGTKMKKFFRFMCLALEKNNQKILKREFVYSGKGQNARGYLVVVENKDKEIEGPLLSMKSAVENFKRVRKKTYKRKGRIYAKEKIDLKEVFGFLKNFEGEMGVEFFVKD